MSFINNFNQIDILIITLTIISMIYGYSRGLIKEILSILSILISVYISINVYPNISLFIKEYIDMAVLADSISFALMFLFLYSLVNIFSNFIVSGITNSSKNNFLKKDKFYGYLNDSPFLRIFKFKSATKSLLFLLIEQFVKF